MLFCLVNAAVTLGLGLFIALVMQAMSAGVRIATQAALLLAWAMPVLAVLTVWQWMFDTTYGVVNWALTALGGDFSGHSWLIEPLSFFGIATLIIVWMSVPFVAFTVYAGLTQVSTDAIEAAMLDGAGTLARVRHIMLPAIKPVLAVVGLLQIVWDLRVFAHLRVAAGRRHRVRHQPARHLRLPARHRRGQLWHGGRGRHVPARRHDRAHQPLPRHHVPPGGLMKPSLPARILANAVGVVVILAAGFPVYWMVNTSFLPTRAIRASEPTWVPFGGSLDNYVRLVQAGDFTQALWVSLQVAVATVAIALVFAFLAASPWPGSGSSAASSSSS